MREIVAGVLLLLSGRAETATLPAGYTLIPGSFESGHQPDGNSIVIDAPEGLIVFDTGRHAEHQQAILDRAAALAKPIVAIVNSHWHLDHSGGNAEIRVRFPKAAIVTSRAVEGALSGFLASSKKDALAYIASGKADAATKAEIEGDIAAIDERVSLLPTDPVTVSGARTIVGRKFAVHLAPYAATAGDVWLYDRAVRVLLAGDLVVAFAPFMDTACPEGWRRALGEIASTPFEVLVPGHGAPMSHAEFDRWRGAFDALLDCAASDAVDDTCIAGWRERAAPFMAGVASQSVDRMIRYYLTSRLRAPPAERTRYCAPA